MHSQEKLKIAVVPKGDDALFWKSVHSGLKLGAITASNVDLIWKAPQTENDKEQQISIIEQFITENVSGLVLSPIHQSALAEPVAKAMKKKIPVLIFDSALKGTPGKDFICFVGINNRNAGKLAGEHLAKLLKGKGKVVLLRYIKNQATLQNVKKDFSKRWQITLIFS
jgi:ribose transport system substrate-binding protein